MVAVASTSLQRPLRRDAERNRARIVAAAREAFAAHGVGVGVGEVARLAGVGVGTLYRRFPTKAALVDAVLEEAFAELLERAQQAAEDDDAWHGLETFLEAALSLHARNRALKDLAGASEGTRRRAAAARERIGPLIATLVRRAQEQGALRPDVTPEDVPLVFWGASRVVERAGAVAPELWRRYLRLVLDGLRAEAATPLPHPPLSRAQLRRALEAAR